MRRSIRDCLICRCPPPFLAYDKNPVTGRDKSNPQFLPTPNQRLWCGTPCEPS